MRGRNKAVGNRARSNSRNRHSRSRSRGASRSRIVVDGRTCRSASAVTPTENRQSEAQAMDEVNSRVPRGEEEKMEERIVVEEPIRPSLAESVPCDVVVLNDGEYAAETNRGEPCLEVVPMTPLEEMDVVEKEMKNEPIRTRASARVQVDAGKEDRTLHSDNDDDSESTRESPEDAKARDWENKKSKGKKKAVTFGSPTKNTNAKKGLRLPDL